jgi:hypothetical protein
MFLRNCGIHPLAHTRSQLPTTTSANHNFVFWGLLPSVCAGGWCQQPHRQIQKHFVNINNVLLQKARACAVPSSRHLSALVQRVDGVGSRSSSAASPRPCSVRATQGRAMAQSPASLWDLRWTKWHWDRFSSEFF